MAPPLFQRQIAPAKFTLKPQQAKMPSLQLDGPAGATEAALALDAVSAGAALALDAVTVGAAAGAVLAGAGAITADMADMADMVSAGAGAGRLA